MKKVLNSSTNDPAFEKLWSDVIERIALTSQPALIMSVPGHDSYGAEIDITTYRYDEYDIAVSSYDSNAQMIYSVVSTNKLLSVMNISRTLFIMILLLVGSLMFNSDANKLVLDPIERMSEKVKLLASNPLGVINDEVES